MISIGLVTLGCPKNQVDSEIMLGLIDKAGFLIVDDFKDADVVIINTCGFIESAKQESINTILEITELKDTGKLKYLMVTGCLAQRYHEELLKEIPEIDVILGTGNFDQIVEVIQKSFKGEELTLRSIKNPTFDYRKGLPRVSMTPGYTAYVKISEGCNNRCSYCVIPDLRGPLKSRPEEDIVEEVQGLVNSGVKEVILVAQDTTVYGMDLYGEPRLVQLLKKLVKIEEIVWIRIMYSYPDHLTDELIKVIAREEKICKYLDIPLQHVSDSILKLMNRPTKKAEVEGLISKIRQQIPDVALRTSLIVGFPGETERDFLELVEFVQQIRFERLGVFTYSREEGTPADRLKGHIPEDIKEERWNEIMSIQREIALENNEALIGRILKVLVEEIYSKEEKIVLGRTQWDAPEIDNLVYIHDSEANIGDVIKVKIVDAMEYDLVGVEI